MGAVTPAGIGADELWAHARDGVSCIREMTRLNPAEMGITLTAEIPDFKAEDFLDRKDARRADRFCQYAYVASDEAVLHSGLEFADEDMTRVGVIVGSGIGGMETIEREHGKLMESGPRKVAPLLVPMIIGNMASGNLAIRYGLRGICTSVVTACATGTTAIGDAFRAIKYGHADVVLAGGADAAITPLAMIGFANLSALTKSTDPERGSIPFDAERSGFVMGEGAAVLVLEELEHAVARGANILAEVVGYGATGDGYHMTAPHPEGEGAVRSMKLALDEAGATIEDIDYINAHGTSTPMNDKTETAAVTTLLGARVKQVPVSSTKSVIGHLLGASGAAEAIVTINALREGFVPPTAGYRVFDPECDLDVVPLVGREADLELAISNSLGFGGHNATIALSKWKGI